MAQNKLDPEFKDKWVKALRSGEYLQFQGKLKGVIEYKDGPAPDVYGYCCLGVAAVIAGCKIDAKTSPGTISSEMPGYSDVLEPLLGGFRENRFTEQLVEMNDGSAENGCYMTPFPEIADWIEENL